MSEHDDRGVCGNTSFRDYKCTNCGDSFGGNHPPGDGDSCYTWLRYRTQTDSPGIYGGAIAVPPGWYRWDGNEHHLARRGPRD